MESTPHKLIFKKPSGTSRGVLYDKKSWFLYNMNEAHLLGIGEISLIQGLSPEQPHQIESTLQTFRSIEKTQLSNQFDLNMPAVQFGLEMYRASCKCDDPFLLFDNSFSKGLSGIPINGLIWMGNKKFMFDQLKSKISYGYRCLKLKIGAIEFEEELSLLKYIRTQFSERDIEIRVDANGAFAVYDAFTKLEKLAELQIHSIEQPIKAGQWQAMANLCQESPIPIALDEELIGIYELDHKMSLLETIRPQYIILKPSLVGGWTASEEWISMAESMNIGWWVTSALESNIGLNAIAQWVASMKTTMPQGLGTGGLYVNNIGSPLIIKDAQLWYNPKDRWDTSMIINLPG